MTERRGSDARSPSSARTRSTSGAGPIHVLVINQFHRTPHGTGSARLNELARHWTAEGAQVTVVSSTLEHASGERIGESKRRWTVEEQSDGARVVRAWTLPLDKSRAVGRIARDLSFSASGTLAGLLKVDRPDVVLASSPPLFTGLVGAALARAFRAPLVFELRDLWPDFAVEFGALGGTSARMAYALESWLYKQSSKVVAVTPAYVDRIRTKGVPESKIGVVPNGVDLGTFHPGPADGALRTSLGWEGRFVALYAGVHGPSQALDQLLLAAEALRDDPRVLVCLVGDGAEKARLRRMAAAHGMGNVQFLPAVPREDVPALLRACDVGVATLKRLGAFRTVYPAKLFEIMGCARPVLLAGEGAAAELVTGAGAGVAVPPEDPPALAAALSTLADDPPSARRMGEKGRQLVTQRFDREALAADYLTLLRDVAARGR